MMINQITLQGVRVLMLFYSMLTVVLDKVSCLHCIHCCNNVFTLPSLQGFSWKKKSVKEFLIFIITDDWKNCKNNPKKQSFNPNYIWDQLIQRGCDQQQNELGINTVTVVKCFVICTTYNYLCLSLSKTRWVILNKIEKQQINI